MNSRRNDLAAVLLLVFMTTLFFADVLFGPNRVFIRDLTRYYFPTKHVIREIILGGEFPYWNPYYSAGQPMAANPEYEIFYPLQLLILLPNYDLGYRLHIFVHYYIVTVGMYLLLRSLGLRIASALMGSISVGLGGLYMSFGNLLPILFSAAWIPWVLLFARRLFLHPTLRDFALAAVFLGLQCLVGEPTTLLQTWILLGFYALYRSWHDSEPGRGVLARNLLLFVLLVAAGLAVGAAQIIPAFDHVGDSARSRPFTFDLVTAWSMPYARPLELFFPNLFGHIYKKGTWFWGGGIYPGMGAPFLFSLYLGLLPAILLISAIFVRIRGSRLVLLVTLLSLLLALGKHTPLYRWLYDAHLATSVRYPEKFIFFGLFACAVLAAMVFDRLIQGDARVQKVALTVAVIVFVLAFSMAIFATTQSYDHVFRELWNQQKSPNARFLIRLSRDDWSVAAARCGAAALLLGVGLAARTSANRRLEQLWSGLLVLFVTIDVAPTQFNVLPRVPSHFFTTPPPLAATLDPDRRDYRIFHEADWYGSTEVARKFFGTGDAVYWIVRNGLFPMTAARWGYRTVLERDYDKTHLHPTIDLTDELWKLKATGRKNWRDTFMAMSNARYYTEYRDFESERKRSGGRFKVAQAVDVIRAESNPRYYLAEELVTIRDAREFLERLVVDDFVKKVAFVHFPAFAPATGTVRVTRESANTVDLQVETASRSFLVLSVTPHKYWQATLDGAAVPLQRANIGYQGIIVPAGRHTARIQYRNALVPMSLAISLLTTATLLLSAFAPLPAGERVAPFDSAQGRLRAG